MATSAVRYKEHDVYIRDSELGELIKAITAELEELIRDDADKAEWLVMACTKWTDNFENMPPGLKDIELDEYLSDSDRRNYFERVLEKVVKEPKGGQYSSELVCTLVKKVLEILKP